MKRDIKITLGGGITYTATIVIDKNGMRVENKNPAHGSDRFFIRSFIRNCIDMDAWNHSWHMDLSRACIKKSKERKEVRKILNEKILQREQEIQKLKDAKNVLGKW